MSIHCRMKNQITKILSLVLMLIFHAEASAQNTENSTSKPAFVYQVEALSYFDNREYDADFQSAQTLFATRLSPEIGLQVQDHHRLMLGAHYTQHMGRLFESGDFVPTLYYRYQPSDEHFRMYLGAVPYTQLSEDLPAYALYDSIAYVHPNIQGALLQYQNDNLFVDAFCDWRSLPTDTQREAFRLLLNARYQGSYFHAGALLSMNHLASKKFQKNGVCDDAFVNPTFGIDLPWLDTLSLTAGYILAYQWDRIRSSQASFSQGFMIDFQARWRRLALKNSLYLGENLQPLYPQHGNALYLGDPFYQSSFYNRCDIYCYLIQSKFVNCLFSWNLHYTKEFGWDHQQQLICRFSTETLTQSKNLRNLFEK